MMSHSIKAPKSAPTYNKIEERINIYSHGFGFILSLIGFVLLITRSLELGAPKHVFSFSVFGASLILLYAASTLYHSAKNRKSRYLLNILDHASIYVLIAGTYTPFALVTLYGNGGKTLFFLIWGIAIAGILFKVFFTGKLNVFSTILYIAMGWLVVIDINPLLNALPLWGLIWLFSGGLFYTIGALIFSFNKIPFNHAIFHFLVLAGSFCHFIAIYYYVL